MQSKDINMIRHCLPEETAFPYYADRESPWLLAQLMDADCAVADLRRGARAKLLSRPLVRPMLAACGTGRLAQRDVLAVGHAARAPRMAGLGAPARAGLAAALARPWHDFVLSFDAWGDQDGWGAQMSRPGGNLVVQLGFPSDHSALMGRYLSRHSRKEFEYSFHPVRQQGRPTLAWARLDIDLSTGVALIEEVQSDWLRLVAEERDWLRQTAPQSRHLRSAQSYEAALRARYGRIWPRAMLLAVLVLLRDEFACREVWMHQPEAGAVLKGIDGTRPPRSLYSDLPKAFCFTPADELPVFLAKRRKRLIAKLKRRKVPLFWRLRFET